MPLRVQLQLLRREAARQQTACQGTLGHERDVVGSQDGDELGLGKAPEKVVGEEVDGREDVGVLLADGQVVFQRGCGKVNEAELRLVRYLL